MDTHPLNKLPIFLNYRPLLFLLVKFVTKEMGQSNNIVILLAVTCVLLSVEANASNTINRDTTLEVDLKLKLFNKPAVKSIKVGNFFAIWFNFFIFFYFIFHIRSIMCVLQFWPLILLPLISLLRKYSPPYLSSRWNKRP